MITKQLLRDWRACWSDADIDAKLGKRSELSPREVAVDTDISVNDRLWVLTHCLWYLDETAARGFAIECALSVAHLAPDEDEHRGLLNSMLEIEDLSSDQQAAAYAAYSAASAAYAARSAAYAAYAARSAAYAAYAAESAAYAAESAAYAAESAAYAARSAAYAARSAAMEKSIERALEWLGDYADGWEEA